jgi:hypothetical protein
MIRLVTVTGSRTTTLKHMLNHYKDMVDEMHIVVYDWEEKSNLSEVQTIVSEFPNAKIVKVVVEELYNWEKVTKLYNEVKSTHPNDWWVISDDDEFHVYPDSLRSIISNCDANGWEMVRGGFIDRIGEDGEMVELLDTDDIFEKFPYAGFFRHPLSGANPNKICLVKGNIEITNGQHYAKIDGHTTWRWQGWNHPLIAPIKKISVQVHHFKWDSTCAGRIRHVANQNKDYSYSEEYRVMYRALSKYRFKLPLDNERFGFELSPTYHYLGYSKWKQLIKKIISI